MRAYSLRKFPGTVGPDEKFKRAVMPEMLPVQLRDDLTLVIGKARATLTPTQGLRFSEELARASFRRALTEEAAALAPESAEAAPNRRGRH